MHKIYEEKQIDTKWKKGTKDPTKTKNEGTEKNNKNKRKLVKERKKRIGKEMREAAL